MAIAGKLSTMPLPELLQWLGNADKSGTLVVERNKAARRIVFRDGRVTACTSNEPDQRLGQFLLSRGKVDETTLRDALTRQETTGEHLGGILVAVGALGKTELTQYLRAQAEEWIFGLFDWEDANFRFHDGQLPDDIPFPLDLCVEDILLKGVQRLDETRRIKTVFHDPGIVLARTGKVPPAEIRANRLASRIIGSVNGERTVAEIVLQAHTSEYLVTRFLFELYRGGYVEIREVRTIPETAAGPAPQGASAPGEPDAHAPAGDGVTAVARAASRAATSIQEDLRVAHQLMDRGEYDAALEILNASYRDHPDDEALGRLLHEAEAAFVDKAYRHFLPPSRVPVLRAPPEALTGEMLTPPEFYLISRIDGTWSVKSIIQISPLREVDALRTLKRMREKGFIELRDPD